jgi:hypothetical protein
MNWYISYLPRRDGIAVIGRTERHHTALPGLTPGRTRVMPRADDDYTLLNLCGLPSRATAGLEMINSDAADLRWPTAPRAGTYE